MKTRTALAGASIAALLAAGGVGWGYSDPSSIALGPLTSILGAVVLGHVPSNASLANVPARLGRVRRDGALTPGDGGAAEYTLSAAACSAPDGGTQISLNGGGCATIDPSAPITPELFPASIDQATQWQAAAVALCARSSSGGRVTLASVVYNFSGLSQVNPSCPVQFDGKGYSELSGQGGTWVHIASTGSIANGGVSPFTGAQGTAYERFGISQDMPAVASGWAPTPYPVVFNLTQYDMKVRNVAAAPVYDFIKSTAARADICGIQAQALHKGIDLDNAYDVTHSSCGSIELWPFWNSGDIVMSYMMQNLTALAIGGVDGAVFPDVFIYAAKIGVLLHDGPTAVAASSTHYPSAINIASLYTDSVQTPLSSPDATGQAPYQYPYGIHIGHWFLSCAGAGNDVGSGKNSAGYTAGNAPQAGSLPVSVGVSGAIDLAIDEMSEQNCAGSIFGLPSTT